MQIKFHTTLYDLVDSPNIQPTHFQCTIQKGDSSYDDIIVDTVDAEEITVYDDEGDIQGIYNGYTKRIAICIIDDISIELANTDIEQQIDTLTSQVNDMQDEVNSKVSSTVIAEVETIGDKSRNPYKMGETFMGDDGNYYKAATSISTGSILVVHGNIEPTTINETINESIKESEVEE